MNSIMSRNKDNILDGLFFFMLSITFVGFISFQEQKKSGSWDIPQKYKSMTNPYANDSGLERVGKMLYIKHCKSCHGSFGEGDGPKASRLKTFPGDFKTDYFRNQSDGELYYKSIIGRDEMPNYEKKIVDEEDQWGVINYLRKLSKKN